MISKCWGTHERNGSLAHLSDSDHLHQAELSDDGQVRDDRDAANRATVRTLVRVRGIIENAYSRRAAEDLGFKGSIPRSPKDVRELGEAILSNAHTLSNYAPSTQGLTLEPVWIQNELGPKVELLKKAVAVDNRETREADMTLSTKHKAMKTHDERFVSVGLCLEGLFRLAGEPALAAKVRPSRRRGGRMNHGDINGDAGGGHNGEEGGESAVQTGQPSISEPPGSLGNSLN